MDLEVERALRRSVLQWFDDQTGFGQTLHFFTWEELRSGFSFRGRPFPLLGMPGIWKPRLLSAALSIRTA